MFRAILPSTLRMTRRLATKAEVIDGDLVNQVSSKICSEVSDSSKRLFAVVYLNGRQWKVSQGDLIALEGELPLSVGDSINLEKILMVGGSNFSVFGRPLLDRSSVTVRATVVEKNTKSPEVKYYHNNHMQSKTLNWLTREMTTLRINEVTASSKMTFLLYLFRSFLLTKVPHSFR